MVEGIMDVLAEARKHAKKSNIDPLTAAKRAAVNEKSSELYAHLQTLSSATVRLGDKRGKIHVTLGNGAAHVNVTELAKKIVRTPAGQEIRWKDNGKLIGGWSCWFDGDRYVYRQFNGPEKPFADQSDLLKHLAKQVGQVLE